MFIGYTGLSPPCLHLFLMSNEPTDDLDTWFGAVQRQFKGTLIERMGQGESIDQVDGSGTTALMHACLNGHVDFTKWLLSKGANPNFQGLDQKTALQCAYECVAEKYSLALRLLEGGADLKVDTKGCEVVGMLGIRYADISLLTAALDAGLDPNKGLQNGFSAVEHASMQTKIPVLDLILQRGGCVDGRQSENEFSPLMLALYKKNPKVAEFLLDAGANPLARYWHPDEPEQILVAADIAQKTAPDLYPRIKALEAQRQAQALDETTPATHRPRLTRL